MSSKQKGRQGSAGQSSQKKRALDRFIPHSVARNLFTTPKEGQTIYEELLNHNLIHQNPKVLNFHDQQAPKQNKNPNLPTLASPQTSLKSVKLPQNPYKILPANNLKDDFYLNLLDYADSGHIGVGLQGGLFIWSGCATKVTKAYQFGEEGESICSVGFMRGGSKVALGLSRGELGVLDFQRQKLERLSGVHLGRIGSVGCGPNLICSGGRDGYVSLWDPRQQDPIFRYRAHDQQICGLRLGPASDLVATGGNDNKLALFSLKKMGMLAQWSDHRAAVKAIGFNPSQATITSGGGSADRSLRVFSLQTLQLLNQVDTGSQVCNLVYSPVSQQLLTTHGYSLNQLTLWRTGPGGELTKTNSVMGHKKRVLYLAGEHQGGRVVTGAGDEELRLWRVFEEDRPRIAQDLR